MSSEGYVLTAGDDQLCFLWSLLGQCIGRFGPNTFNVSDPTTWVKPSQIRYEKSLLAKNKTKLKKDVVRDINYVLREREVLRTADMLLKEKLEPSPTVHETHTIESLMVIPLNVLLVFGISVLCLFVYLRDITLSSKSVVKQRPRVASLFIISVLFILFAHIFNVVILFFCFRQFQILN